MINILVCEDDKSLNELLTTKLKKSNYNVYSVYNGLDGLNIFYEQKIDIILTDIMMPLCDGFELLKEIRKENSNIPIIFMSARDDMPSKQIGYKNGIDDYITKPFNIDELILKIGALERRLEISKNNIIQIKNFMMNNDERVAFINDEQISFTAREFNILFKMLSFPKKTFTRSNLMEEFWDFDSSATSRTVDVYLSKLREKTKDCDGFEIQTVHGLGYKVVLK